MDTGEGSVTRWLRDVEEGDEDARTELWKRYYRRLARLVRPALSGCRAAGDESDVAQQAFMHFFDGIEEGRFGELQGRDALWRLLVVLARRKSVDWLRSELAQKRGGAGRRATALDEQELLSEEPAPEMIPTMLDELRHMLTILREVNPELALIAAKRCEGQETAEIARSLGIGQRKVQRKLQVVRILVGSDWERRFGHSP